MKSFCADDGQKIAAMAHALAHRGPDDFGFLLADSCAKSCRSSQNPAANSQKSDDVFLANRRLVITDLSDGGRQPLSNENGDIWVVFNGAIHNYPELRAQLRSLGHVFRTQTDTEIIAHAYEEWGADCARRFNGMWAYAIWDARAQKLVLSRDRFGIKPMLFARTKNAFWFASEAKAIFAGGEVLAAPHFGFFKRFLAAPIAAHGGETAFENIESLPAAHNLELTRDGEKWTRFWNYDEQSENYDFARPLDTFSALLEDAVRLRLRGDVEVALLLSGGLDSSAIAASRALQNRGKTLALNCDFAQFARGERRFAAMVAQSCGLELQVVEYENQHFLRDLERVTRHMEAPVMQGQDVARWQLLEAAARCAPVVLEGQGADELLGGYERRCASAALASEIRSISPHGFARKIPEIARSCRAYSPFFRRRAAQFLGLRKSEASPQILASQRLCETEITPAAPFESPFSDSLARFLHFDCAREALPYVLHFGDALSMAHGVEARLPFLDHRLVEFCFALPATRKVSGGQHKRILREAMRGQLPDAILERPKSGFQSPLAPWISLHLPQIRALLLDERAAAPELLNRKNVGELLREIEAGNTRNAPLVLRAASIQLWCDSFI